MNRLKTINWWFVLRAMVLAWTIAQAAAVSAQETCESEGIEFGFFNGVDTLEPDAQKVVDKYLPTLYGPTTPKGQPITYTLYYNDTEGLSDFVEVFEQRLKEQSDLLDGRFELFFEATRGGGSWWDALTKAMPTLDATRAALADAFRAALIRDLAASFIAPPETYAEASQRHRDQIDHAVGMGRKMLLFAHSQGNLFVNAAYKHAVARSDFDSVRVVHVAPASPGLSGGHTLADLDLVINGLRAAGTVAPITDQIPGWLLRPPGLNGETDLLGHGLLEIYLNPALTTAGRVRSHVEAALQALDSAPKKPLPPYPDFVATPWTGGEKPQEIRSDSEYSHRVDYMVIRDSRPHKWQYSGGRQSENGFVGLAAGWGMVEVAGDDDDAYRISVELIGKGVGGMTCGYRIEDLPEPYAPERYGVTVCRFDRYPKTVHPVGTPIELWVAAGGYPEPGTTVWLSEETYYANGWLDLVPGTTEFSESFRVTLLDGAYDSGVFVAESWVGMQTPSTSEEPYWVKGAVVVNQAAINAWERSRRAFEAAEERRYYRYYWERVEYERRRKACEAASIPAPPPAPSVIGPPSFECVPSVEGSACRPPLLY